MIAFSQFTDLADVMYDITSEDVKAIYLYSDRSSTHCTLNTVGLWNLSNSCEKQQKKKNKIEKPFFTVSNCSLRNRNLQYYYTFSNERSHQDSRIIIIIITFYLIEFLNSIQWPKRTFGVSVKDPAKKSAQRIVIFNVIR